MKTPALFLLLSVCASAEVRTLTLRQALDLALKQNPDLMLARLDQEKARYQVTIAKDPFQPKVYAGSGAAWTYGFPSSIEGSAPAIAQVKTQMAIFDRPQTYQIAQAKENVLTAGFDIEKRQEEVVYRVAFLYLEAEQAQRSLGAAQNQADSLAHIKNLVDAGISEGRVPAIESKKANIPALRAQQRVQALTLDRNNAEISLAAVLGFGPEDQVRAAEEDRGALAVPLTEQESIANAIANNPDLKKIESAMKSKTLEIKSYQAQRLPKVNLVAQYALLGQYNNYSDYFKRFQRNNIELGASFEIPILVGRSAGAYVSQAETDVKKLSIEAGRTRTRISGELHRAYDDLKRAENARDLARLDRDLALELLSIDLAQFDEGRVLLAKVEESRATMNDKFVAYYESMHSVDVARLNVLRQNGTLLTALK